MVGLLLCLMNLVQPGIARSQGLNSGNLSSVQVGNLSDSQVRQLMAAQQQHGLNNAQLDQLAQSRGVSPDQLQQLHARMEELKQKDAEAMSSRGLGAKDSASSSIAYWNGDTSIQAESNASAANLPKIFGQSLFRNPHLTFEPDLSIPTPVNYQLGPGDELVIDVYGYSEADFRPLVSKEGSINIPNIGIIYVNGLTIEQAAAKIKAKLATIYSGIKNGTTSVVVNVGRIRSIKVTIMGEVQVPGTYTLPSLATVFNALYSSGGPTDNGSLRTIEVFRNNKLIDSLDVYEFLMHGDQTHNIRLMDQDIIRVPVYIKHIELEGQVKRPGIYELKSNETLQNLLTYAGGFTDSAYKDLIHVVRLTTKEKQIQDVSYQEFSTFIPQSGDVDHVSTILDKFSNRVSIEGAVYRPGSYQLTDGMSLKNLINKAEGLREDAFLSHGYIVRQNRDLTTSVVQFNVASILDGNQADILLKKEDIVHIYSIFDLRDQYTVSIAGDVRDGGKYKYSDSMTLEDLIMRAGGLSQGASHDRIEVSRRFNDSSHAGTYKAQIAHVFSEAVDEDLKSKASSFVLKPYDIVAVRQEPGFTTQKQVRIEGEVKYPGIYTLTYKNERISDLIKRAGGLTQLAYAQGASLMRPTNKAAEINPELENKKKLKLGRLQASIMDTSYNSTLSQPELHNDFVGIHLDKILKHPDSKTDIFMEDGDVLNIPSQLQTVTVSGEVLYPVNATYISGKRLKYYISQGGGFSEQAKKGRVYVLYANGFVRSTRHILFVKHYPNVRPGAEIFVPQKRQGKKVSASEIIGLSSGVASIVTLVLAMIKVL